jgi:hypothetical protein
MEIFGIFQKRSDMTSFSRTSTVSPKIKGQNLIPLGRKVLENVLIASQMLAQAMHKDDGPKGGDLRVGTVKFRVKSLPPRGNNRSLLESKSL